MQKTLCLAENYMPAALLELGVIDSEDVWLLEEHQEDMAQAVARGVRPAYRKILPFRGQSHRI